MPAEVRSRDGGESGVALITVLALLATLGILTATVIASSLYLARGAESAMKRSRAFYRSESAFNRAAFYLRRDRAAWPERRLGEYDYSLRSSFDRFMADGLEHRLTVDGVEFRVVITDAMVGMPIAPAADFADRLRQAWNERERFRDPDLETNRRFSRFLDKLTDYLDTNSFKQLDGMEEEEYLKLGRSQLPRNGAPEYVGEFLYIPGAEEFLFTGGPEWLPELLPPAPRGLSELVERVSLFSSPIEDIGIKAELSDREMDKVTEALEQFRAKRRPLNRYLETGIQEKFVDLVESTESGVYRIEVTPLDPAAAPRLRATLVPADGARFVNFYEVLVE